MNNTTYDLNGKLIQKGHIVRVVNHFKYENKIASVLNTRSGDVYLQVINSDDVPCWIMAKDLQRLSTSSKSLRRFI